MNYTFETIQKKKEVKEDIEAIKKSTGRSDEELQQWVTDVKQWAIDSKYLMFLPFDYKVSSCCFL